MSENCVKSAIKNTSSLVFLRLFFTRRKHTPVPYGDRGPCQSTVETIWVSFESGVGRMIKVMIINPVNRARWKYEYTIVTIQMAGRVPPTKSRQLGWERQEREGTERHSAPPAVCWTYMLVHRKIRTFKRCCDIFNHSAQTGALWSRKLLVVAHVHAWNGLRGLTDLLCFISVCRIFLNESVEFLPRQRLLARY